MAKPDTPCSSCGKLLYNTSTSLPAGQITCRACRSARRPKIVCGECGKTFAAPVPSRKYCSRSCANTALARIRAAAPGRRVCEVCGDNYRATYPKQRTCGRRCGTELRRREGSLPAAAKEPRLYSPVWFKACEICGELFTARRQDWRLCRRAACRAENARRYMNANYPRYKARLTRAAHDRRARLAQVEREDIDPIKVYERDKWTCQVCRKRVRRKPRRLRDPLMASLDHIVPVVDGGTHTYANVRCTHLKCNLSRGRRGGGEQLMLIGA